MDEKESTALPREAAGARPTRLDLRLSRASVGLVSASVALAVGLGLGIAGAGGSVVPDVLLSGAMGVAAFFLVRIVERAGDLRVAPRSSKVYGEELREAIGGLLDSSLRTAEHRAALAGLLQTMPREFADTIELGSELGFVIEREFLQRAQDLGLIEPICWRSSRVVDIPRLLVDCQGASTRVEVAPRAAPTPSPQEEVAFATEATSLSLVERPEASSASRTEDRVEAPSPEEDVAEVRRVDSAFGVRGGKIVPIQRARDGRAAGVGGLRRSP